MVGQVCWLPSLFLIVSNNESKWKVFLLKYILHIVQGPGTPSGHSQASAVIWFALAGEACNFNQDVARESSHFFKEFVYLMHINFGGFAWLWCCMVCFGAVGKIVKKQHILHKTFSFSPHGI